MGEFRELESEKKKDIFFNLVGFQDSVDVDFGIIIWLKPFYRQDGQWDFFLFHFNVHMLMSCLSQPTFHHHVWNNVCDQSVSESQWCSLSLPAELIFVIQACPSHHVNKRRTDHFTPQLRQDCPDSKFNIFSLLESEIFSVRIVFFRFENLVLELTTAMTTNASGGKKLLRFGNDEKWYPFVYIRNPYPSGFLKYSSSSWRGNFTTIRSFLGESVTNRVFFMRYFVALPCSTKPFH